MDPNALAGYRRALARRGVSVTVRRITGEAPNATTFDATVTALVMDYVPKAPVADVRPEGEITLGARNVIVLADDLAAASFPLPVQKHDKVVVDGEELDVMSVDPNKRGIADAIELVAQGV